MPICSGLSCNDIAAILPLTVPVGRYWPLVLLGAVTVPLGAIGRYKSVGGGRSTCRCVGGLIVAVPVPGQVNLPHIFHLECCIFFSKQQAVILYRPTILQRRGRE